MKQMVKLSNAKHKKDDDATLELDLKEIGETTFKVDEERVSDLVVTGVSDQTRNGTFDIE